ncbi:hypothetical protein [Stenotrophomonas phage RAS14]
MTPYMNTNQWEELYDMHSRKPHYFTGEMVTDYCERVHYHPPKNKRIKRSPAKTARWERACETYRVANIRRLAEVIPTVCEVNRPYSIVYKAMIMGLDFLK